MTDLSWLVDQVNRAGDEPAVLFDRNDIARELVAYGEIRAAETLLQLDEADIAKIGALAHRHYSAFAGETGPMLDTALCRAVVEHLEGRARPLARLRRVYPKDGPALPGDLVEDRRDPMPSAAPSGPAVVDARAAYDAILDHLAALAPSDFVRRKNGLKKTTRQARFEIILGTSRNACRDRLFFSMGAIVQLKVLDPLYRGKDPRRVLSTGWLGDFVWPEPAPPPASLPRWELTSDEQIDEVAAQMAGRLPDAVSFLRQFETEEGILGQLRSVFDLPQAWSRQLGLPAYLAATGRFDASHEAIEDLLQRFAGDAVAMRVIAQGRRIIDEHYPGR